MGVDTSGETAASRKEQADSMRAQSMKSLDTIAVHGKDLEAKDMDGDGN